MTRIDDVTVLRNLLVGRWAAEKLGLQGQEVDAYASTLAAGTLESDQRDVFSKIRKDFDGAGVAQSDEQILLVMEKFMLKAGSQMPTQQGDSLDAAAVILARNLTSR